MRILIVDDNVAVRKVVRETLKAYEGLEVVESRNGAEAIEQASQFVPDLIVMDISMPGIDGLRAATTTTLSFPKMRILIFTMHKLQELIESARMIGLSGYVAKEDPMFRSSPTMKRKRGLSLQNIGL